MSSLEQQLNPAVEKVSRLAEYQDQSTRTVRKRLAECLDLIKDKGWEEVIELAVNVDEADLAIKARRRELLNEFNAQTFFDNLTQEVKRNVDKYHTFRGYMFEYFVGHELHDDTEDSLIADFILNCLRQPQILGELSRSAKNPDHIGVIVDSEKEIAYVTGLYEAKLNRVNDSGTRQIKKFHKSLQLVIHSINAALTVLKQQRDISFIPRNGIALKPYDEMYKFVVVGRPTSDERASFMESKREVLANNGWKLRFSVFPVESIEIVSAYLMSHASEFEK